MSVQREQILERDGPRREVEWSESDDRIQEDERRFISRSHIQARREIPITSDTTYLGTGLQVGPWAPGRLLSMSVQIQMQVQ